MRRPASASTYRPFWQPAANAGVDEEQREAALLLARRDRIRRAQAPQDNVLFNPMRHRMRYFHELSERRRARARELAAAGFKLSKGEKAIPMVIVDTDGGSYQAGHGVKNVCADDSTVYCSHKRNNVNIIFEHPLSNVHFELTRIVVKTPLVGYSSPVREGLIYISMEQIEYKDTERYDRPESDDPKSNATCVDPVGFNVVSHRRERGNSPSSVRIPTGLEFTPPASGRKEVPSSSRTQSGSGHMPILPKWGTPASHKRKETEPVVSFQIPRGVGSAEILFNPPITGRYILVKLFNDVYNDPLGSKPNVERPERSQRVLMRQRQADDIPPVGDPLRFDIIDDDLEEQVVAVLGEEHDLDVDFENVDVQAILFYGYTGRRCFPSIKDL